MGLDACGSVSAVEIGTCGLTRMGFNACGLVFVGRWSPCLWVLILVVLVVEIGACGG